MVTDNLRRRLVALQRRYETRPSTVFLATPEGDLMVLNGALIPCDGQRVLEANRGRPLTVVCGIDPRILFGEKPGLETHSLRTSDGTKSCGTTEEMGTSCAPGQ